MSALKTEAQTQEQCQHSGEPDIENSMTQHRGPGLGLGLGMGPGWGRNFGMANDTGPDDEGLVAEME